MHLLKRWKLNWSHFFSSVQLTHLNTVFPTLHNFLVHFLSDFLELIFLEDLSGILTPFLSLQKNHLRLSYKHVYATRYFSLVDR